MTLKLYNTLTRRQENFESLEPGKVKMYCCGVTVYDYCHLGHARSYIAWDTIRRYLMWRGYQVRYVQNFTDIDDKILNRARETGTSMESVAERFTETYFEDMKRLNVLEADEYPRATQTIDGIQQLINDLEKKGFAYSAGGDVYYQVREFTEYGKLSGRRLEEMQAGASGRVGGENLETSKKKDPFDFALWKAAKPGEPAWNSPWGEGRPGWHIECSAMVRECLGETIDIHGGGADLIFPHHENEVAQSEAATGKSLAKYWLHNGFVTINGEKMSKSLGNFTTIRDLLDKPVDPMAVRMFVLTAQYRKPIDFTPEAIASAENGWNTIKEGILFAYQYGSQLGWETPEKVLSENTNLLTSQVEQFQKAMDDDINTPGALAVLFELAKELRREGNILVHEGQTETSLEELQKQWITLVKLSQVLGLEFQPNAEINGEIGGLSDAEIESLIQQRLAAKKAKNYSEADRIRDELQNQGIKLIDQPGGVTRWHRN
ncbi:MAG: cysteine--tRNA ligase [Okeania sp. SIO2C9]|uniref:cysteine--tRNA ligase n=1 Tax=Okeania sp. SIO2C9 TaxID=2607791 RepID=UPI0013C244C2|nr:cysteine--tRNA ligase [Okeania sp. SIO2C9]NEQ74624.1 cysteine--tRNA ligase [Okeania sp. SIO2C9]